MLKDLLFYKARLLANNNIYIKNNRCHISYVYDIYISYISVTIYHTVSSVNSKTVYILSALEEFNLIVHVYSNNKSHSIL